MFFQVLNAVLARTAPILISLSLIGHPGQAAEIAQNQLAKTRMEAGPHLDGDAYRALRTGTDFRAIAFDVSSGEGSNYRNLEVILGPDFVIERTGTGIAIYDLRYRRLLRMEGEDGSFSNDSLFGMWRLRWAFLQNNLFAVSVLAASGGGSDKPDLMRFWVEQANGLSAPDKTVGNALPKPRLRVQSRNDRTFVQVSNQTVATVESGEVPFPGPAYASTFAAWLTWSFKFHPDTAAKVATLETLPARIDRVLKEPDASKPGVVVIAFQDIRLTVENFDILSGRKAAVPAWEPHFPKSLAALMVAAASGQAPNGPVSDEDYTKQIRNLIERGKALDALLLAIHASHPYDGCTSVELSKQLCDAVSAAARNSSSQPNSKALIDAINLDSAGKHAEAALLFISLRTQRLERPDILEIMILNSLVEGKKKQQLDAALEKEFDNVLPRIVSAFKRDPYDPSRYRDFYNYLHAAVSGLSAGYQVHLRAYPVIDLGRSLPSRRIPSILSAFTEFEMRVSRSFPVHFPAAVTSP